MRKLIYTIGIFGALSLSFCFSKPLDCKQVRNGSFYYFAKKTRERVNVYRQDSLHIETDAQNNEVPLKSKIVWKNDCENEMYINAYSDRILTGDDSIIATTPANVKIIHIDKSYYVCIATLNIFGKSFVVRDTLYFKD